ncbi:RNA polymerase sigma factor [Sorangium sp. So ce513]|uniref:RNA polymerase sigma factor n=1 Tax=Sorangium sp. So ce513 TaxID=3133315 RepID=UPI003F61EACC
MRSLASRVGVPSRDLDDVVQDAMVRLWEKREQARTARNPGAFRDSVVLNTARDHRRAARRREEALTGLDEAGLDAAALRDERRSPEELAIARQEAALVRQLIDQIGERGRGIFIACELLERPIADVARELEIPFETARSRLRRAWEEFEEAAARWEARQRGRGARRRSVLFAPWLLLDRRSFRRGGPARWMAPGFAIACAAALGVLVPRPMDPAEPLRTAMATLVSRTMSGAATAQAAQSPAAPAGVGLAMEVTASPALDRSVAASPALDRRMTASPALDRSVTASPALDRSVAAPAALALPTGRPAAQPPAIGFRERDLVARARAAMAAGDVVSLVEARRLLEEHARRFPRGRLANEREALLDQLR